MSSLNNLARGVSITIAPRGAMPRTQGTVIEIRFQKACPLEANYPIVMLCAMSMPSGQVYAKCGYADENGHVLLDYVYVEDEDPISRMRARRTLGF